MGFFFLRQCSNLESFHWFFIFVFFFLLWHTIAQGITTVFTAWAGLAQLRYFSSMNYSHSTGHWCQKSMCWNRVYFFLSLFISPKSQSTIFILYCFSYFLFGFFLVFFVRIPNSRSDIPAPRWFEPLTIQGVQARCLGYNVEGLTCVF